MGHRLTYTLFMLLALIAFLVVRRLQPHQSTKLPRPQKTALGVAAFIGGMIGARIGYIMANFEAVTAHFDWLADGKTVLTGIALAYLSVEVTKLALGIRVKTGDDYALPLALALAVGRWGCFFNGCCFGTTTTLPWAVAFHDGLPRHPTQIYESFFHLFMAAILLFLARKQILPTHRLQLYLIVYCFYRFLTEFIRPEPAWFLGWTFYQWTSLAFAAALAGQWVWDDLSGKSLQTARGQVGCRLSETSS